MFECYKGIYAFSFLISFQFWGDLSRESFFRYDKPVKIERVRMKHHQKRQKYLISI